MGRIEDVGALKRQLEMLVDLEAYAGVHLSGDISVYPRLKVPAGIRVPAGTELTGAADILRHL